MNNWNRYNINNNNSYYHEYYYFCFLMKNYFDNYIINYIISYIFLYLLNKLIGRFSNKAKYFKIHAVINLLIILTTFHDMVLLIKDPLIPIQKGLFSRFPRDLVFTFHIFHLLNYDKVSDIDKIHHLVMSGVIALSYLYNVSIIANYLLFYINGLPGLIDYIMLILVKYKKINTLTEKRYNSYINILIRSPFTIIGNYILVIRFVHELFNGNIITVILSVCGIFWNGQYFAYRVIQNYGLKYSSLTKIEN